MPLAARGFWYSATLFMLALVVAAAGCSDSGSQGASPLPPDKYVAVLETISYDATVIEGNCMLPAPSPLPPYPFDYDSTKGRITLSTSANASLKILYGIRHDSYVPWAMSYRLDTCGIYSLPYTCESGPVIADADGNGTVYLAWENRSIALKPGDGWSRESAPGIQVINRSGYSPFTARFVTTYRIANLGIFDKPRDK